MFNKSYELLKWLSETTKTLSWVGSAVLAYFRIPQNNLMYSLIILWYFIGLQILAFKLNLRALEEKEI